MDLTETIQLEKLVHGGQALGRLRDGRAVFVWGALPGEQVRIEPIRQKKDYVSAVALEVISVSPDRVEPKDAAYLSTSPWQILSFPAENTHKHAILTETMQRAGIAISEVSEWRHDDSQWQYRNKMEYSFWGDDDGLHLAFYQRGSNRKQIVTGSSLAMPAIDETARAVLTVLDKHGIRAGQLKSLLVRATQAGQTAVSLYVKDESFPDIPEFSDVCAGLNVHLSTPKSPASIITKTLKQYGDSGELTDTISGKPFRYSVDGFFQVNIPMFEHAVRDIRAHTADSAAIVDMYAGVGAIGLSVGAKHLVELDVSNIRMARQNAGNLPVEIIRGSTEETLSSIGPGSTIIFDPPRSGLHPKLVRYLLDVKPRKIVYLSCNPVTQARDIVQLQTAYKLTSLIGYNFFPKTPHIESLAVLEVS